MHLQGVQSALEVGTVHNNPAVKTTGTKQRLIQNLRTVGSCKNHNALGRIKAVNLTQQLIECLIIGTEPGITGMTHSVNFIDENDTGCHLCRLLEQAADTAGAYTYEHFFKVRTGNGEERHTGLTCHSLGKQSLTGTGRTYQQHALGQLCADFCVFSGVMQEVDNLLQGLLRLILTGHILECHTGLLFHIDLGFIAADIAHNAVTAHTLCQCAHYQEDQQEHTCIVKDHNNGAVVFLDGAVHLYAHIVQLIRQFQGIAAGQTGIAGLSLCGRFLGLLQSHIDHPVIVQLHFIQLTGFHSLTEIGICDLLILALANGIVHQTDGNNDGNGNNQRKPYAFRSFALILRIVFGIILLIIQILPLLTVIILLIISHFSAFCNEAYDFL